MAFYKTQSTTQLINFDDSIQHIENEGNKEQDHQDQVPQDYTERQYNYRKKQLRTGLETQSQCGDLPQDPNYDEQDPDYTSRVYTPIIKRKIRKEPHKFPGESKNIPKNFARALREYIKINFPGLNQKDIQSFLNLGCEQTGKHKLLAFLNTSIGTQIARKFFGDFGWAHFFLKDNKADVGQYFRFYNEYYNQSR